MKKSIAKLYCKCIRNKEKRKFIYNILIGKNKISNYKYENPKKSLIQTSNQYCIRGQNNKIILIENGVERQLNENERIQGLEIKIDGNDNLIKLEMPIIAKNSLIDIQNNNVVVDIGQSKKIQGVKIICRLGNSQYLKIGSNTTFCGTSIFLDERSGCIIGEDCMFSDHVTVWPIDGHTILDNNTGEILNTAKEPIVIGNHVWVGQGARITKNARIGNNCIIGGGTVACKDYKEDNVIIAGNPGKIIKRNVNWDRRNPYYLQLDRSKNLK